MIKQKQDTIHVFVRLISKCFIILGILVSLNGCSQNKVNGVDVLSTYSIENLDNFILYYDNDLNTINEKFPTMVDMSLCVDCSKIESLSDTMCKQIKSFENGIKSEIELILKEKCNTLDNYSVDENNLQLILEGSDIKIYFYNDGFIKICNNNTHSILQTETEDFNTSIEKIYDLIAEYNLFKINLHQQNK